MTIRFANVWEIPAGLPGAKLFHEAGNLRGGFVPQHFVDTWTGLLESGRGKIVAMFDEAGKFCGGLGAVLTASDFSPAKMAYQTFWFMMPEHRGAGCSLVKPFEDWAKAEGAASCVLCRNDNTEGPSDAVYQRLGYRRSETRYVKELSYG